MAGQGRRKANVVEPSSREDSMQIHTSGLSLLAPGDTSNSKYMESLWSAKVAWSLSICSDIEACYHLLTGSHTIKELKNTIFKIGQWSSSIWIKIHNFLLQRSPTWYMEAGCLPYLWVQSVLVKNIWKKLKLHWTRVDFHVVLSGLYFVRLLTQNLYYVNTLEVIKHIIDDCVVCMQIPCHFT